MTFRKENAARAFSRAAKSYDSSVHFQKRCTEDFDRFIGTLPLSPASILEAGCGTGNLTDLLHRRFPNASIAACDLADGMTEFCRTRFRSIPRISVRTHDFDSPFPIRNMDLTAASLSLQWSDDLRSALRNLADTLKPDGLIAFSIPLDESLSELHAVFSQNGTVFPGLTLPSGSEVLNLTDSFFWDIRSETRFYTENHDSLRSLLRTMRGSGTAGGGNGTSVPVLKKILAENRETPFSVHYRILFVSGRRKP